MDDRRLYIIERSEVDHLIRLLWQEGFTVIGPTVREQAIVLDRIDSAADLPAGWSDRQEAGRYEAVQVGHGHYFHYVLGQDGWKRFLFPPRLRLFHATREGGTDQAWVVDGRRLEPPRHAFFGVRACELAAMSVFERVTTRELIDPYYQQACEQALIVAVNCTEPGGTCFCASMGTGPRCVRHFDLCLTELDGQFSLEIGTETGAALWRQLDSREATAAERRLFALLLERATDRMGREMETGGLPELLAANLESPRWEQIARRCLACANCTLVCPTCFCYNVHDHTDLAGRQAERVRLWGSCFTLEFSYLGATTVRTEVFSRYRQWMTHKLSSWHEQFGVSGCVGCGRCITWCPVGIDITAEAAGFRRDAARQAGPGSTNPTEANS